MSQVENAGRVRIREAVPADLCQVRAIYDHHVRHGFASFEEIPPDLEEIRRRHAFVVDRGLPFLVAQCCEEVKGFAYAAPYRPRPAYRFTVENSVYIAPDAQRLGLGRRLLEELIEHCTDLGYRQMIAVIGDSGNTPSISLHEKLGFRRAGLLRSAGFKFGRWVDSVLMQRPLGAGDTELPGDRI
jgi:phosphinothricin acetyltransferase